MREKARCFMLPLFWLLLIAACFYWKMTDQLTERLISGTVLLSGRMTDDLNAGRGVYVMRHCGEKYIVGTAAENSGVYEAEQLTAFCSFVQANGSDFLYVNAPCKSLLDDSIISDYFGIPNSSNANADRVMEKLRDAGVPYLDLRENVKAQKKDVLTMFYRTDHHWRTETGLWAVGQIADALNARYDMGLDPAYYTDGYYDTETIPDAWIGEQGALFSPAYIGYDSFTAIQPREPGHYLVTDCDDGSTVEGDFSVLYKYYRKDSQLREEHAGESLHYSYCPFTINSMRYVNCDIPDGKKILLIGDSFSYTAVPFFLQGVRQVDTVLRRADAGADLCTLIEENHYDAVIVLYAQFMIGAHDDTESANYNMFKLMP